PRAGHAEATLRRPPGAHGAAREGVSRGTRLRAGRRHPGEGVTALARERDVAMEAARAAAAIIRRYYKTDLTIELKGHDDPLTAADREPNACIHEMISRTFPDDGSLSEDTADSSARLREEPLRRP